MNGLIISQKENLHKVIKSGREAGVWYARVGFEFDVSRKAEVLSIALLFSCALSCEPLS